MPLTPAQIAIVKSTVPILEAGGVALTTHFYGLMLREHEEVRALFNPAHQASGAQPRALANAVLQYARCIDSLDKLPAELVPQIVHKHVALSVVPEQYPIVGSCLLRAIREVLGAETATDEVLAAWGAAYGQLADILIGVEESVYAAHAAAPGGWRGTRGFRIARKVKESDAVMSFHLEPVDGKPVMAAAAGHFLGLDLVLPCAQKAPEAAAAGCPFAKAAAAGAEQPVLKCPVSGASMTFKNRRNYSLSAATGAEATTGYRISVKRVEGGAASTWLHDATVEGETVLQVFPPSGAFTAAADSKAKGVMLLSGGVGITPVLAMLQARAAAAAAGQEGQPTVSFVHSTHNGATHALKGDVAAAVAALNANKAGPHRAYVNYTRPRDGADVLGRDYDAAGRVDAKRLSEWLPAGVAAADVEAYFVGPKDYMRDVRAALTQIGVPAERQHWEFFGPASALE
jgi:nitric oxide dioxygenase